jgi:hypothetical protein
MSRAAVAAGTELVSGELVGQSWGEADQVCPPVGEEGFTTPCDSAWRDPHGLGHTMEAASDRPVSIIRNLQVHDPRR